MPNYEPTPRRFSILSVAQPSATASRRNSFDTSSRPSLVYGSHGAASGSVDLEEVLSQLGLARGRSRNGADSAVEAPVARRRESSASTRDRIALWEERSRSQERMDEGRRELNTRARSKSRLRNPNAGHRVSIVPEVPELVAACRQFEEGKWEETEEYEDICDTSRFATPRQNTQQSVVDRKLPNAEEPKPPAVRQPSRPHTPSRQTQELPTPDATPKERVASPGGTLKRRDSPSTRDMIVETRLSSPLPSPWQAIVPSPPTTPVAVPPPGEADDRLLQRSGQRDDKMGSANDTADQAWRISTHKPDFPVPTRYPETEHIRSPGRTRFEGEPLQKPRRSQVPEAAGEDYPYATSNMPYPADWAVNIQAPARSHEPVHSVIGQKRQGPLGLSKDVQNNSKHHEWDAPPVIERALYAASVSMIKGLEVPVDLYRGLRDVYYPTPDRPDIIKAYPVRRRLPVRIFFPARYDVTSPALLPALFTIHGGGFTVGAPSEDDVWNRGFADSYSTIVIALNYSKAPWTPFPGPLLDVEALYHAVLNDESLPIDRMRTAIAGFDAGANLALGLSQLSSVKTGRDPNVHQHSLPYFAQPARSNPPPAAVISICGILDFTVPVSQKLKARPYKKELGGPRGWGQGLDWMGKLLPSSAWSYIPYGHDAADPLLSPAYAVRGELPPHVFVAAAELDCLAHESWKAASVWGGRPVPAQGDAVGRAERSLWRGCLEDADNTRFSWIEEMEMEDGGRGSTRWLLVPDVVHGFDSANWRNKYLWGDEEARMDAEMKTMAYQRELAEWLWGVVWR